MTARITQFEPIDIFTAIENQPIFQDSSELSFIKYKHILNLFHNLVMSEESSSKLLERIRTNEFDGNTRMGLLKVFRRLVCPMLDTEMSKKITKVSSDSLIKSFNKHFTSIESLRAYFAGKNIERDKFALASLLAEYDNRGKSGYDLTDFFFDWFENKFGGNFSIEGPRRAGQDIELSSILPDFHETSFPCDFVIRDTKKDIKVVGFARYDSTRGGSQSDDRTGSNALKVVKLRDYSRISDHIIKIIFLSDGPGICHNDTWCEIISLDGMWDDNVKVITLKIADIAITSKWLDGSDAV